MKTNTVKGTNDYLPDETALRDYLKDTILDVYAGSGYEHITTPALEDAENLDKSDGGDNLNLIFKILKRGAKLDAALADGERGGLSDMGLRYDLTLPLSRYYANNKANLPVPFKAIQIDRVYRAERPQRGRLREFVQCDIDVLGSDSPSCETELIYTTAKALLAIDIGGFAIKVNDRRLLNSMLLRLGFSESDLPGVCVAFDKMDKDGKDGVVAELEKKGYDGEAVGRFANIIGGEEITLPMMRRLIDPSDMEYIDRLEKIIEESRELSLGRYDITFDASLVRGQGYYTGTIFEVESLKFNGAIAGGGRYDGLIGKFTGTNVPAVGFSIGFERIYSILADAGYKPPSAKKKAALFYAEGEYAPAAAKAEKLRKDYDVNMILRPKKLGKYLGRLEERDYYGYLVYGESDGVKCLKADG